jgi:LPXTG-site transpeptidase (sortase) family protein
MRILSWTLVFVAVLGVGMAGYPWAGRFYPPGYRQTVEKLIEWSNVLSDLQTNRLQAELEKGFLALGDPRLAKEGDPLTRLEIPKLKVNIIVVQGTTLRSLAAGAGHYTSTPLPGTNGNVAIAGHRTTHGRPFSNVDRLVPGDRIVLTTPVGRFTYKVTRAPWITTPWDWSIVGKSSKPLLTLSACHPNGSARQRIVVRAALVRREAIAPVSRT